MNELVFLDSKLKMPFMMLPVRTTIVPLSNARVLISPGSMTDPSQYRSDLAITDIVAPNLLHMDGVPKAIAAYPNATVWGTEGSSGKRPDINWQKTLTAEAWPYKEELSLIQIDGMPSMNEVVFHHKASRSIIVTDLCFNIRDSKGLGPRLILGLFGTYDKFGVSRLYVSYAKDKPAFEASLARIMDLEFDDIVLSHGQVLKGDAKNQLRAALRIRGLKV